MRFILIALAFLFLTPTAANSDCRRCPANVPSYYTRKLPPNWPNTNGIPNWGLWDYYGISAVDDVPDSTGFCTSASAGSPTQCIPNALNGNCRAENVNPGFPVPGFIPLAQGMPGYDADPYDGVGTGYTSLNRRTGMVAFAYCSQYVVPSDPESGCATWGQGTRCFNEQYAVYKTAAKPTGCSQSGVCN